MRSDAQKVAEAAEAAGKAMRSGDLQKACEGIALSHYPLGHVTECRADVLRLFEAEGITPVGGS